MPTKRPYVNWFRGAIVETETVRTAKAMVLDRYLLPVRSPNEGSLTPTGLFCQHLKCFVQLQVLTVRVG
jgi:hypothetical protein